MADFVHPLHHVLLSHSLKQIVAAVFCVKLECKRPFVIDELGYAAIRKTQHKSGFTSGHEVQFFRSTFLSRGDGGFGNEGAGDRSHELKEGGRHALLVPMSFRNTQAWLAAVHRLVKIILSLFMTVLLLLLLPTQPFTSIPVSFVFLLLSKNQEVERSGSPPIWVGAVVTSFTKSVLADETKVELKVTRLLFNLAKPSKVVEANLPSPFAGDRSKG